MFVGHVVVVQETGIPDAVWGLLGAVVGGLMAMIGGHLVARGERRAELARSNRIEIYEPSLRELRSLESKLDKGGFPTRVIVRDSGDGAAKHAVPGAATLDVSWWRRHKNSGAHLRIAPSIAGRLDGVVEAATAYRHAYVQFSRLVRERVTREVEVRKDSLEKRFGEVYRVQSEEWDSLVSQFLRDAHQDARKYLITYFEEEDLADSIVGDVTSTAELSTARSARNDLAIRVRKSIAILETQIAMILKKHEKRNERV